MHKILINYCRQFVSLNEKDESQIMATFLPLKLKKKEFILREGNHCNFIAFVNMGLIRHFHLKDGKEITCDITLPPAFITDYKSFTEDIPSTFNFQALKATELLVIKKKDLHFLYESNKTFESLGRIMAEMVAQRIIELTLSLASDKPEERIDKLLAHRPELFQIVPQKFLANLVGISPESFSRIMARKANRSRKS